MNPFPGPQPYRASDRERFYGREDLSYRLEDNVIANRCVTVYGPSGAGKTSVMQASVFPRLVESHEISVVRVDSWPEAEAPSRWLASAMYAELGFGALPEDLSPDEAIVAAARRVARRSSRLLVVYLDQMEQLLYASRSPDETDAFFECVHALVELPLRNVRVVLSLREDYLGRFRDRLRELERLLSHGFRVGPLTVAELCDAVCKAAATGEPPQTWSPEEMRVLMLQVRVPGQAESDEAEGQAAYAQIVCRALFQTRAGGNADAECAKAEPILRGYFDTTLDALGPLRESAERLLEDHLVTADGTRTLRTEKELLRILPEEELSPVLKALEGAAILHAEEHEGSRYFELGHDWLARKVHEQREAREREEAQKRLEKEQQEELARQRKEAAEKLAHEHGKRKNLRIIATVSLFGLVVSGVLGCLALYGYLEATKKEKEANEERDKAKTARDDAKKAGSKAHNAQIMSAFREITSVGQLGWAMKVLAEMEEPEPHQDWISLANNAYDQRTLRATLIGHKGPLSVAVWSPHPDDKHPLRVLTASADRTAQVWTLDDKAFNEKDPVKHEGHEGAILAAAWFPDAERIVTGSEDGTARVWRADGEGKPVGLDGHKGPVVSVDVSTDGKRVVTGSTDKTARVYVGDEPAIELTGHKGPITAAMFHPDGVRVITTSDDRTARVWAGDRSGSFVELKGHKDRIVSVTVSPDGKWVVTTSLDQTAHISSTDGRAPPIVLQQHKGSVTHAAVSPDSKLVATACSDGIARVWSIDGKGKPVVLPHGQGVTFVAFRPDGKYLATISTDKVVRVFASNGAGKPLELRGHDAPVRSVAWSPDGQKLVTAASDPNNVAIDRTAKVWSVDRLKSMLHSRDGGHLFHAAFIGGGGQKMVAAYDDDAARLWFMDDGSKAPVEFKGHLGWVANATLSPDGKHVVTASFDKTARVWSVDKPEGQPVELRHEAEVRFAAFNPDGTRIVTVSDDNTARVWNADGSAPPRELGGHKDWLTSAAWSRDGSRIVTTSLDNTARVFRADGRGEPVELRGHVNDVLFAAWDPEGNRIVTTSKDRTALVWDVPGNGPAIVEKYIMQKHEGTVLAAAWDRNGKRIATSTAEKAVHIWNADGKGTPIVLHVPAPVIAMQFREDGKELFTVDEDNTAHTLIIDVNELKSRLLTTDTDCLPPVVRFRSFDEPRETAKLLYRSCEKKHRREPSPVVEGWWP